MPSRSTSAAIDSYAIPLSLYRYRSLGAASNQGRATKHLIDRELDGLCSGQIFCPRYDELNDPMEGMYQATLLARSKTRYPILTSAVFDQKSQLGVASLSESWDNELMWAHYADQFFGICVRYNLKKLLSGLPSELSLTRVLYCDRPHLIDSLTLQSAQRSAKAALSAKSLRWAYEREWRLFAPVRGSVSHNSSAVSAVYLGARMHEVDRDVVRNKLKDTSIPVYETKVDGYAIKTIKAMRK